VAGVVARARPLDLDHLGAEVGEQLPAPRPREHARQLDDAQTFQRPHPGKKRCGSARAMAVFLRSAARKS